MPRSDPQLILGLWESTIQQDVEGDLLQGRLVKTHRCPKNTPDR